MDSKDTSAQFGSQGSNQSGSEQSNQTMTTQKSIGALGSIWNKVTEDYELLDILGKGTYGLVVKAKHRSKKRMVAIKLMENVMNDSYEAKRLFTEIYILRKMSQIKDNVFTCKIYDIILPEKDSDSCKGTYENDKPLEYVFVVMEYLP